MCVNGLSRAVVHPHSSCYLSFSLLLSLSLFFTPSLLPNYSSLVFFHFDPFCYMMYSVVVANDDACLFSLLEALRIERTWMPSFISCTTHFLIKCCFDSVCSLSPLHFLCSGFASGPCFFFFSSCQPSTGLPGSDLLHFGWDSGISSQSTGKASGVRG